MAAAFVSSIVIHILNEGKGKQEEIIKSTSSSVIDMLLYCWGIHTQKEIESKDPIPCGIEKIKRRWEKKKKKRLLANDMRRGPAKKKKK